MPRQPRAKPQPRRAPYSLRPATKMPSQIQTYLPVPMPLPPMGINPPHHTDAIMPSQSGPWSPEEDDILLNARARGLGWDRVKLECFPNKTSNACRKRYERLVAKRKANDWDEQRIQRLALAYRNLRAEVWRPLAEAVGEKWEHVEKACMEQGLKNLQNFAANHTRIHAHARRQSGTSPGHSDPYSFDDQLVHDDSGINMGTDDGSRRSSGSAMPGWNQILREHN